jgi:carboxyl-terminal processing protease
MEMTAMENVDLAGLTLRLIIGCTFAAHGAQKAFGWWDGPGFRSWLGAIERMGFRPVRFFALASAGVELVGGLFLALGMLTPVTAAALIAQSVVIIGRVHWRNGFFHQRGGYEYPLVLAGGVAAVALLGAGAWSVDGLIGFSLDDAVDRIGLVILGLMAGLITLAVPRAASRPRPDVANQGAEAPVEPRLPHQPARLRRSLARSILAVWVGAMLIVGAIGLDRTGLLPGSPASDPASASPQFALVHDVWDLLHDNYVGRAELDDTKLAYAAAQALADAVGDPGHTTFETPAEVASEQGALAGKYVGIGISLEQGAARPVIAAVYPASPAARAGLVPGDVIVAIGTTSTAGLTLSTIIATMSGPAGSSVTLTIESATGGHDRTVVITRQQVVLPVVEWASVPGTHLALIRIDQFSSGATGDLVRALGSAKAAGAAGIVLDLRGDPGGFVDEAVGVASQFIGSGVVYRQRDASGNETSVPVVPGGVALTTPLVVLVDGATASSAEVVAGALQDAKRARIVGQTTYGTGTVLSQFALPDGSELRVGTVEWLTRDDRQIWHQGIVPDVSVALPSGAQPITLSALRQMTAGELGKSTDHQLMSAIHELHVP